MRVLIICTYFPPDTAIAAIRPYMFAKYLARLGHNISVLTSGRTNKVVDSYYKNELPGVEVYYYDRRDKNDKVAPNQIKKQGTITVKELWKRWKFLSHLYNSLIRIKETRRKFNLQKHYIDTLSSKSFDYVISTFGELENISAGQYASKVFGCPLVMDYRDLVAIKSEQPFVEYLVYRYIQRQSLRRASINIAISEGLKDIFNKQVEKARVYTIYNGYEAIPVNREHHLNNRLNGKLSLCYTGQIYGYRQQALFPIFKALRQLIDKGVMHESQLCFVYAGKDGNLLQEVADKYDLTSIVDDRGYVNRFEIERIQLESNIFIVLSWNTKYEKGILTGKFYEGIRCDKPILVSVAGEMPESELYELNKKYCYGYCYETARDKQLFGGMCDFIANTIITSKGDNDTDNRYMNKEIKTKFLYENLVSELNNLLQE